MEWNKIHKSFKLDDISFLSVNELLRYGKERDVQLYEFLKDWFNSSDFIAVYTSGSTGKPKEIQLQKKHVLASAKATGSYFYLPRNTKALLCLPSTYIAGKLMVVRALILGWHLDYVTPSSNPLQNINKTYDFSAFTPMQLENSLDNLHHIKKLIVGGGSVSKSLLEKIQTTKTEIFATYGMTETITHIAVKKLNHNNTEPTFYSTLPDVNIYIDNRNCLVIKAPKVSDDVIFTNDVVQLISNTQFEWLGRFDNVINSGGVKLHPETIENKLEKVIHSRFFVAGVPDNYLGEKLVLVVEGKEVSIHFEEIGLSKFEKPKEIYFVNEFVETNSGKIQRNLTLKKIQTK